MSYTQNQKICESTTLDTTSLSSFWANTNWFKVGKYVDKLQKRIYCAEYEGDFRKLRNTQRILYRSDSVLLSAIKRVTQTNKGRKTAGIDGFRALTDKKRAELFYDMKEMNINLHVPKPAFRTYIRKKNGKLRPLSIPIIMDRVYQEIVRMVLEPQAEVNFEPTSYGFRPRRGVHDAVERIFNNIRNGKWCWVFEGDFKSCFDTLDHDFILRCIYGFPLYNITERFLKAGYVDNDVFYRTDRGTPQGGLLSPLLANIALTGMEEYLNIQYKEIKRVRNGKEYSYFNTSGNYCVVRYADDFLVFAKTNEDILEVYRILQPYLDERGLTLAEDKTKITHIAKGFDFLGFNFRQYKTKDGLKCFIKPSKKSIKEFKAKISEKFRVFKGHSVDELIDNLNPLIRGTANYWRTVVSKEIFTKMDHYIWTKTKKFLSQMHKNKGWKWIKNKYFPFYFDGKHYGEWVLTGPKKGNHLIKMSWTPIRRHIMIKHNSSPYDKNLDEYFENRKSNHLIIR